MTDASPAPSFAGGCQCGAVRYELRSAERRLFVCHCKECQKQSASAFGLSMPVALADLTITGETATYRRATDSGSFTTGHFCPRCGVRILHVSDRNLERGMLKAGTLDDTSGFQVAGHVFTQSKQDWFDLPEPASDQTAAGSSTNR